jgi:ribonuclease-3
MNSFASIKNNLRYHFQDPALLQEALLAAGATENRAEIEGPKQGNKRLALVGDAALRLAVLDKWFQNKASTGIDAVVLFDRD